MAKIDQTILIQRIEGGAIAFGALLIYFQRTDNWLLLILGFLAIDFSMAGYLINNRWGALLYNLAHSLILPIGLYFLARLLDSLQLANFAIIWFAHIGIDRALGFGLKLPGGFNQTHLGRIGR